MDARHLIGLVLTPLALAVPANASAVTCDGPASADNGAPQVISGCDDASVGRIAQALGTSAADLDRLGRPQEAEGGRVVRLQQSVEGVPVFDGQVALSYDRAGDLDMVQSSAIPQPQLDVTPAVTAAAARATAGFGEGGTAELVVYPNDGRPILAWHVERATRVPSSDLNAIVDAQTGALVRSWNAVQDVDSDGSKVFDPNPVQTSGDTALTDGSGLGDNDTAPDAFRSTVTLTNLVNTTSLTGDYADVTFPANAAPGAYSRVDSTPLQGDFEAVNAYYAITQAQKKIQSLGFPNFFADPTPLLINADAQDNSNYNPATQAITYGFGGVDDAEDAEIVLHEYGHAIQDAQVPGFGVGDEQGAMGEGFGDFLAGMYYLDQGNPTYEGSHRRYCIGEWDATTYNPVDPSNPGSGCLRWIDGTSEVDGTDIGAYSGTPTEVHDDGRFWSAGMTCIFEGLGGNLDARDKALTLVIDSQTRLVPVEDNTAFEAQIESMIVSDQNLFGGGDVTLIRNCAAERGLATLAETIPPDNTPPTVEPVVSPAQPDGKHGFYVHDVAVSWAVNDPESAVTSSGCDPVSISKDTPAAGTTLTCTATSSGGMTSKSVTIKRQAKNPNTKITKHPPKRTNNGKSRFVFHATVHGARFKCSLDGGRFRGCDSPETVAVGSGRHKFEVRSKTRAGKKERKPAKFTWTVGSGR
jgi:hypothetical protein